MSKNDKFQWVEDRIAHDLEWIRNGGGSLKPDGGFNEWTYPALCHVYLLRVAFDAEIHRAGPVRGYLALRSFRNSKTNRCFPAIATVAKKAGLSVRAMSNVLRRSEKIGVIGSLRRTTDYGTYTSCEYDFGPNPRLARDVLFVARGTSPSAEAQRLPVARKACSAEIIVMAAVLEEMRLTQASYTFTRKELARKTGLSVKRAVEALYRLIKKGHLVKVGEGSVSLPEALQGGKVRKQAGAVWLKRRHGKKPRQPTQAAKRGSTTGFAAHGKKTFASSEQTDAADGDRFSQTFPANGGETFGSEGNETFAVGDAAGNETFAAANPPASQAKLHAGQEQPAAGEPLAGPCLLSEIDLPPPQQPLSPTPPSDKASSAASGAWLGPGPPPFAPVTEEERQRFEHLRRLCAGNFRKSEVNNERNCAAMLRRLRRQAIEAQVSMDQAVAILLDVTKKAISQGRQFSNWREIEDLVRAAGLVATHPR